MFLRHILVTALLSSLLIGCATAQESAPQYKGEPFVPPMYNDILDERKTPKVQPELYGERTAQDERIAKRILILLGVLRTDPGILR
jgi:hypothetical protein